MWLQKIRPSDATCFIGDQIRPYSRLISCEIYRYIVEKNPAENTQTKSR